MIWEKTLKRWNHWRIYLSIFVCRAAFSSSSVDWLDSCRGITDTGVNNLKEALRTLSPLQHLSLNFLSCDKITDGGLNYLKESLKGLNSLRHLSLDFSWYWNEDFGDLLSRCGDITNAALNHLKESLKIRNSLKSLCLKFMRFLNKDIERFIE